MTRPGQFRCFFRPSLAFACLLLLPTFLFGGTHTWTGAVSSQWSNNANWTGGTPAGDPDADLVFPDVSNLTSTDDIAGVTYLRSISFNAPGYTISALPGSSLAVSQGIYWQTGTGTNTISASIQVLSSASVIFVSTPAGTLELSGPISGGELNVSGSSKGTLVLSGNNTNSSTRVLAEPRVLANSSQAGTPFQVHLGGFLGGVGTIGGLDSQQGFVRPGTDQPGILNVQGNVSLGGTSFFKARLNGAVAGTGYDRLSVVGSATLPPGPGGTSHGVFLDVSAPYVASVGESFTILTATAGLTGIFEFLPNGSIFAADCQNFQITYTSTSAVLTRVNGGGPPLSSVTIAAIGSQNVCTNSTGGTVTVTDQGGCASAHQWGYRTVSGGTVTAIAGETGTSYSIEGQDFPGVGTYYLVETTSPQFGSPMTSNELTINVAPTPTAAAAGSTTICLASSTPLSGSGAAMCFWSPATGLSDPNSCNPVASPSATTTYSLTVSGASGCTSTNPAQVTVTVDPGCRGPAMYYTLPPCRVVDTRSADGPYGGPALVVGGERVFSFAEQCGVPPGAKALVLNVTATEPTESGFLTLYSAGSPLPLASNLNFSTGQTRAAISTVPLNDAGELAIFYGGPAGGQVHVVIDVSGYFD